MKRNNCNQVIS